MLKAAIHAFQMCIHCVQPYVYAPEALFYLVFERCEPLDDVFGQRFDQSHFHCHFSVGFDGFGLKLLEIVLKCLKTLFLCWHGKFAFRLLHDEPASTSSLYHSLARRCLLFVGAWQYLPPHQDCASNQCSSNERKRKESSYLAPTTMI